MQSSGQYLKYFVWWSLLIHSMLLLLISLNKVHRRVILLMMESLNDDDRRLVEFGFLVLFLWESLIGLFEVLLSFLLLNDACGRICEIGLEFLCLLYLCLWNCRLLRLLFLFLGLTIYSINTFHNNLVNSLTHQYYLFNNIQKRFISKSFFIFWPIS